MQTLSHRGGPSPVKLERLTATFVRWLSASMRTGGRMKWGTSPKVKLIYLEYYGAKFRKCGLVFSIYKSIFKGNCGIDRQVVRCNARERCVDYIQALNSQTMADEKAVKC